MPTFKLRPLTNNFGVEVMGLNLAAGFNGAGLKELAEVFVERKVILIRDQNLTTEQYAAFGRQWAAKTRIDSFTEMHVPEFDDINIIGNVGELFENEEYRNGAVFWHTDCAAEPDPDATTMLYCLQAPGEGGETVIADMQSAYDGLDDETKFQIDHLVAHHCYSGSKPILGGREAWEHTLTSFTEETAKSFPSPVTRPLVRQHSITGRKGLYAPAGSIFRLEGVDDEAAEKLIRRIKRHATSTRYCYSHSYRPGDLLMWDNTSTMHYGKPTDVATGEHGRRLLFRISPLGIPGGLEY